MTALDILSPTAMSQGFDYSTMPDDVASEARAIAERVLRRNKKMMEAAVETGRDLLRVRDSLERGLFNKWVEQECGIPSSTAYRWINVAERLADKLPTVGKLPPTVVYALAAPSTPAPIREEVVQRLEAGEEIAPASILSTISDARKAEEIAKADAKLTEEQRRKKAQKEKRQKRDREKEEAERQRQREAEKAKRLRQWQAARTASALITNMLGDRLGDLAELLEEADVRDVANLVLMAAGRGANEWWQQRLRWDGINPDD